MTNLTPDHLTSLKTAKSDLCEAFAHMQAIAEDIRTILEEEQERYQNLPVKEADSEFGETLTENIESLEIVLEQIEACNPENFDWPFKSDYETDRVEDNQ